MLDFKINPLIIWERNKDKLLISDPNNEQKWINNISLIDQKIIKLKRFIEKSIFAPKSRFSLKWFLPSIIKHKNKLILVVIASFLCSYLPYLIHYLYSKLLML